MTVLVVDTNVIAVANKLHNGVCTNCIKTCIQRLLEIQREGCVAIDSAWEILSEYLGYANPNRQKEVVARWQSSLTAAGATSLFPRMND
jgi:hypothetical protein